MISLLILWGVWVMFTITYIPWGATVKDVVKDTVLVEEVVK